MFMLAYVYVIIDIFKRSELNTHLFIKNQILPVVIGRPDRPLPILLI